MNLVSTKTLKTALLAGTAATAALALSAAPVAAQGTSNAQAVEKVTVTGTRIKQRDFKGSSPIATVSSKDISLTGSTNVESLLNELPQIVPGVTVSSNNPSLSGFATADLRGLGPGRTLVLVNGRRANPSDRSGAVDLNTIPSALIDRVEIVSGGASAVYGADAVAGAINFIMKDDFEGVELSVARSQAEDGVAPANSIDGIIGGKFDGGKGSLMLGVSYYDRQPVAAGAREWSRHAQAIFLDPAGNTVVSAQNLALLPGYSIFNPGGSGTAPWASVTGGFSTANIATITGLTLDSNCNPGDGIGSTGGTIRFNAAGGIEPFQNCAIPSQIQEAGPSGNSDRYDFAPDNLLILSNERLNASIYGKYDIVEGGVMQAFVEGTFTNSRSVQQLAATPVTGLTINVDLDRNAGTTVINPYVAANSQLLALLNLQYAGNLDQRTLSMSIRPNQGGFRIGTAETNALGVTWGLRGNMPSIDWDWEVYHSYARNTTNIISENNVGKTAITQLINACNTTTTAVQAQPISALPNCPFPYKAGATFTATGNSNNPLGLNSMNQQQLDFINVDTADITIYERNTVSANLTGDLWDLWGAGAIAMALGAEYRDEELQSKADPFKAAGDIFGFNAQESISGQYDVYEAYAETNVPLITNVDFFQNLSVEAGYRISDYSTGAAKTETWKYGVSWTPFNGVTFRGIDNHAVRAPTAFELFQAGDQNFPGYTDPCNNATVAALVGAAQTDRINTCTAWFASGGAVYAFPSAFAATNSQVQSFQIGTPSLKPEIADTRTYGVVFNPEWFPVGKIGVSVDHYSIEVAGPISLRSIANIINGCVAAGGVSIPGNDCTLTPRNSSGQIDFVNQTRSNSGSLETSGMDINLRWSLDLEENLDLPGTFGIASLYTKVNHYKSNGVEAVGTHDGTIGGGVPKNRAATNFTYSVDDVNLLVRWTYTGPMDGGFDDTVQAWNVYEFGSSWDIDQNWQLQFGVENIFDKQPQKFAAAQAFGQFNVDGSTYDQLGRQYRFGLTWKN